MLHDFERHLVARNRASGTIAHRIADIQRLALEFDLSAVTLDDLEHVLARAGRSGKEAETMHAMRSSYRVFFEWAFRTGRIDHDPSFELEPIHVPVKVSRIAPDDVVQMSLITATLEEKAMVLLARLAALRLSELTMLKLTDRIGDVLIIRGKGGKERRIYANEQLLDVLLALERELDGGTYYFRGRFGGHKHPQSVNKIITRVTGWNPHSLRHAAATAAFRATKNIRAVSEFLGHSSIAITQRYLHLTEDEQRDVGQGTAFAKPATSPHFPAASTTRWDGRERASA